MKRTIYRDRKTGKWVKKSIWRRSKAQGGTRYARERIKVKRPPPPKLPVWEWLVVVTYDKTGKALGFIAHARTEKDALLFTKNFIAEDTKARNIARSGYMGWTIDIAKGRKSKESLEGKVEYREAEE